MFNQPQSRLLQLPLELQANIYAGLPAQDLTRLERTSKLAQRSVKAVGWSETAYHVRAQGGSSGAYKRAPFIHALPVPNTSEGWRALACERHTLDRGLPSFFRNGNAAFFVSVYRKTWTPAQRAVALQHQPPPLADKDEWLEATATLFDEMNRDEDAKRLRAIATTRQRMRNAIARDDAAMLVKQLLLRVQPCETILDDAWGQAILGRFRCFDVFMRAFAGPAREADRRAVQRRFALDPVCRALDADRPVMFEKAVRAGFSLPGEMVAKVAATRDLTWLQRMARLDLMNENATNMFHYILLKSKRDDLLPRIQVMVPLGADVHAPLAPGVPRRHWRATARAGSLWPAGSPQLLPFMAALLHGGQTLPTLQYFRGLGANLRAEEPVNGYNAWHVLALSDATDPHAVAHFLGQEGIANAPAPDGATALDLALVLARARGNTKSEESKVSMVDALLDHVETTEDAEDVLTRAFDDALRARDPSLTEVLLRHRVLPRKKTLAKEATWMPPDVFKTYLQARRWEASDLNSAFTQVLRHRPSVDPYNTLRRITTPDERGDLLVALARLGAKPNSKAGAVLFQGRNATARKKRAAEVSPGPFTTAAAALMMARRQDAMPLLRHLEAIDIDLHAKNSKNSSVWHALAICGANDAAQVAEYLGDQNVDILTPAEGPNGPVYAIDAVLPEQDAAPSEQGVALKAKFRDIAAAQSGKRQRR
jgi:hypothetical protein